MSLVGTFTIANLNTFSVDVQQPNGNVVNIASQAGQTFTSFGTYTVKQAGGAATYFSIAYPTTRLLSTQTAAGSITGDFNLSCNLH